MNGRRHGSDGTGGPLATASTTSAHPRHPSHDMRDSQASTTTNGSASSSGSHHNPHHNTQSITFATPDHGVISVNLTDLSSALGVRRSDVVSHRIQFHARSAPSHRIDQSLLSSAVGASGLTGTDSGERRVAAPAASVGTPTTYTPSTADAQGLSPHAANVAANNNADLTAPSIARPAPLYRRRQSILRGTQLNIDPSMMPAVFAQVTTASSGLPPLPLTGSQSTQRNSHLPAPQRRGTPPPGGADALRRALVGDRLTTAMLTSGSVPSPLRRSAGLLSNPSSVPHPGPSVDFHHILQSCGHGEGGLRGDIYDDAGGGGDVSETTGLLASPSSSPPPPPPGAPSFCEAQEREHVPPPAPGSSSSITASRSGGTSTPTPLPLRIMESPADGVDPGSATSPSRSVHFSDNIIESISVARGEDEYMHLLVVYSRPWYSYVLLVIFGFLLSFAFLSNLYLERGRALAKDRAVSVPFMFFLNTGIGAFGMLLHLAAVWRPDSEEEQSFFEDPEQRERLWQLWMLGLFFAAGLTMSLVFSRTIGATVAVVMAIGIVGHLVSEHTHGSEGGGDCVTRWDVIGSVVACVGALLTAAGGAMAEVLHGNGSDEADDAIQVELLVFLGWGVSVVASGAAWSFFTRRLREMSQRVSQQFLLTSSLVVCTIGLVVGAYVADVMLSSDSAVQTASAVSSKHPFEPPTLALLTMASPAMWMHQQQQPTQSIAGRFVPCDSVFPDLVILLGGGLCFLLCWYAFHAASFYVDHIAGAACMTIGAALSTIPLDCILALHTWPASKPDLWVILLSLSIAGALVLALGAGFVVCGGVMYRREVEIRIVVE